VNPHQKNTRILLAIATLFVASATWLATTTHWSGALISCHVAATSFWCARVQRRKARRLAEEAEWWRRTKLGIQQSPLDPCCLRFDATSLWHDEARCTGGRLPEVWVEQERIDGEWKTLVASLGDLNREEEA
jgi:hypothetical protein